MKDGLQVEKSRAAAEIQSEIRDNTHRNSGVRKCGKNESNKTKDPRLGLYVFLSIRKICGDRLVLSQRVYTLLLPNLS